MAVPAHDERDFEFATKFRLPIIEVVKPVQGTTTLPGLRLLMKELQSIPETLTD